MPYAEPARLTIIREAKSAAHDPAAVALAALGWVLGDGPRAERLLALTGLTPDLLRVGLSDPAVQRAVLDFLAAQETDLIAAADALGLAPDALIAARDAL